jgi:molybdopterin molybdotransferase
MAALLTFEDALARILELARPLASERVDLRDAAGRVVADRALARADLPPFASSAMDGFAVRAEETPGELPIAFRVAAGSPSSSPLPRGSAAAIATGGAVPDGADAVVPIEQAEEADDRVRFSEQARPGAHIRPRGGDVQRNAAVVEAGVRLGPAQIGALAAAGVADVRCSRRPHIAVLATGSELRAAGEALGEGEIYESNRPMLAATLEPAGATIELLPVVRDEEHAHREALERGLRADVLVTSGGVSVGPHDLVRRIEAELGVQEVFWGVAVKPGKPLSFGTKDETLVFGLPGNPVSSLVGALLFVKPAVLARQGIAEPGPSFELARTLAALRRDDRRDQFLRARRSVGGEDVLVEAITGQESHMIVRASSADALVHVPRGSGELAAGATVRYLPV